MKRIWIYFTLLILMIGCQPGTGLEVQPSLTPSAVTTGQPSVTPMPPSSNLGHLTQLAVADLAQRLKLDPQLITVLEAQPVTWPDASLGCPQPGMAYAQVITPGYLIVLQASGNQYPYHTNMESQVLLCEDSALPSFPVTPGEIDDGKPWMPVN